MADLLRLSLIFTILLAVSPRFYAETIIFETSDIRQGGSRRDPLFYTQVRNYSVGPELDGGVFKVSGVNISKSWIVLYKQPYRNASGNTLCPSIKNITRDDIVKVYDETTTITGEDEPDVFPVASGTVLCFRIIKKESGGFSRNHFFYYTFEDEINRAPRKRISDFGVSRRKYKYTYIRFARKEKCIYNRGVSNTAFEIVGNMEDKKSLAAIKVMYKTQSRYGDSSESRDLTPLMTITSRTPPSYKRVHVFPWSYSRKIEKACYHFEVLNGSVSDFYGVFIRASEFRKCNDNLTDSSGIFSSENYPLSPPLQSCIKNIIVQPGQIISLTFIDAKFSCDAGYVLLSSVSDGQNDKALLCGQTVNGSVYESKGNTLLIKFQTKYYSHETKGYLVRYKAFGCGLPDASLPPHSRILNSHVENTPPGFKLRVGCEQGYVFASKESEVVLGCRENNTWDARVPFCVGYSICNKTLTAKSGTIQSPGYPSPFPKDTRCSWTIKFKPGQFIKVTVEEVKADCLDSYLLLDSAVNGSFAGNITGKQGKHVLCGKTAIPRQTFHTVEQDQMIVMFNSNLQRDAGYFKLSYQVAGCSKAQTPLRRYRIMSDTPIYPVGAKLSFNCPVGSSTRGQTFATGESQRSVTCGEDGKWKGGFPLCLPV